MTAPTAAPNGSQGQSNPLLGEWTRPDETPPFPAIRPEHFRPAFDRAMAEHMAEIEAIATGGDTPSFYHTNVARGTDGPAPGRGSAPFQSLDRAHPHNSMLCIHRVI